MSNVSNKFQQEGGGVLWDEGGGVARGRDEERKGGEGGGEGRERPGL